MAKRSRSVKVGPLKPAPTQIADLVADPENRRAHTARNLAMVVEALQDVGAARSIVIDEDNLILAGNGVTTAAVQAGITKLRVIETAGDEIIAVRRSGLTPAQKRALALYDNRTAELAEWNLEQFAVR
jgi:ParB-like chromosome segregation protein Spo0J